MRQAVSSDTAHRWMSLISGIFVQASAGIGYTFAVYSPPLKIACNYDQKDIGLLGTAKDIGENWGLFPGLLVDILHTDIIFLIGVLHGVLGYGTLWLVASKRIAPLPLSVMALLTGIASNSSAWYNTAVLVIVLRNFPKRRGDAVGLLKGFLGLSGAILMQTYTAFVAPNKANYLFLVTMVPAVTVLLGMGFIRPVPPPTDHTLREEKGKFGFTYRLCLILAGYLMCVILLQSQWSTVHRHLSIVLFAVMAFLLSLFFLVPLRTFVVNTRPSSMSLTPTATAGGANRRGGGGGEGRLSVSTNPRLPLSQPPSADLASTSTSASSLTPKTTTGAAQFTWKKSPLTVTALSAPAGRGVASATPGGQEGRTTFVGALFQPDDDEEEETTSEDTLSPTSLPHTSGPRHQRASSWLLNNIGIGAVVRKGPRRGEDFSIFQAMVKADFWLLFLSVLCGCGSGLTAINNLAQMGQAQGYSNVRAFVALVSIWNFLGRLAGGKYSEKLVKLYFYPRPLFLLCAQLLMIVGHLLFAFAVPGSLYLGSIIVGVCYGAHWSVMPATVSELFGLKSFGIIYNVFAMAIPLGSFFFSTLLAGYIYDREAHSSNVGLTSPPWLQQLPKIEEGTWLRESLESVSERREWIPDDTLSRVRSLLEGEAADPQSQSLKGMAGIVGLTSKSDVGPYAAVGKLQKVLKSGGSAVATAAKYILWTPPAPGGGGFGGAVAGSSLASPPVPSPAPAPSPGPAPMPMPDPGGGGASQHCFGAHCFKTTFLVMALVCLVGVGLNAILVYRTRSVYKSLYDKNERERRPLLRSADGDGH